MAMEAEEVDVAGTDGIYSVVMEAVAMEAEEVFVAGTDGIDSVV